MFGNTIFLINTSYMKIVGHTDYQTTANIYTHLKEDMLRKASVNMEKVFQQRAEY